MIEAPGNQAGLFFTASKTLSEINQTDSGENSWVGGGRHSATVGQAVYPKDFSHSVFVLFIGSP